MADQIDQIIAGLSEAQRRSMLNGVFDNGSRGLCLRAHAKHDSPVAESETPERTGND